jgi:hypothetical protein
VYTLKFDKAEEVDKVAIISICLFLKSCRFLNRFLSVDSERGKTAPSMRERWLAASLFLTPTVFAILSNQERNNLFINAGYSCSLLILSLVNISNNIFPCCVLTCYFFYFML